MTPWNAKLVKLKTSDGVWDFIEPAYPVGSILEVDLDSVAVKDFQDDKGKKWNGEVVNVLTGQMGDMPTELLEFE